MTDSMQSTAYLKITSFINQFIKRVMKKNLLSLTLGELKLASYALFFLLSAFITSVAHADAVEVFMNEGETSFDISTPVIKSKGSGNPTLSVEFSGYDISSFANIDQNVLHVDLAIPVSPGKHLFQVLLFWPNGDIDQLANGSVTVRPSSASNTKWKVNTLFSPQYRLEEKNVDQGDQDSLTSTGSIEAQAMKTIDNWQIESNLLALYDSVNENDENFNEWLWRTSN